MSQRWWTEKAIELGCEPRRHPTVWAARPTGAEDVSEWGADWVAEYERNGSFQFRSGANVPPNSDLLLRANEIAQQPSPGRILEPNSAAVRSVFDIHNLDPAFLRACVPRGLSDIARRILNSRPVIYQSHLNYKIAGQGEGYDWHSDFCFWRHHDGMLEPRAISVVIAIDEHRPSNGGLKMIDRSHKLHYPTRLRKKSESWKNDEVKHGPDGLRLENGLVGDDLIKLIGEEAITHASMSAGDFLVMDANTWHSSGANQSDNNRVTLFLILTAEETAFDESYLGYRPGYITCRKKIALDSI